MSRPAALRNCAFGSDRGIKRKPVVGLTLLVGNPPNIKGDKGATEEMGHQKAVCPVEEAIVKLCPFKFLGSENWGNGYTSKHRS